MKTKRLTREKLSSSLSVGREDGTDAKPKSHHNRVKERVKHLRRHYNMTMGAYDSLLDYQQGGCAICGKEPPRNKHLAVDHDHRTGRIRGLLCTRCNVVLGLFEDRIELLLEAVRYLR